MNKNSKTTIVFLVFVLAISGCRSINTENTKENPTSKPSNERLVNATLYQQISGEYRALCYQAFNIARFRIDESLKTAGLSKKQAVVVDIDETVLDNSPFEAKSILEGTSYPTYWKEWAELAAAKPVPGSLKFLKYAQSKGFEIFYISNRKDKFREPTLKNLMDTGFPFADNKHLLLRTHESSKKARRETVSATHNIVLLIGDNLNDFSEVFEKKSVPERFDTVDKYKDKFGNRFIVLPNAMYGSWEDAVYNYDYSKSSGEKTKLRYDALKSF